MSEMVVTPSDYMIVFGIIIFCVGMVLVGLAAAAKIICTIVSELRKGDDAHERSKV